MTMNRLDRLFLRVPIRPLVWLGAALLAVLVVMGAVWRTG
jgi:hypothetical protein